MSDTQYVITTFLNNVKVYYRFENRTLGGIRSWAFILENATKYTNKEHALEIIHSMGDAAKGVVSIQKIVTILEDV